MGIWRDMGPLIRLDTTLTGDRHHCIITNIRNITLSGARISCACAWITGITLAVIPIFKWKEGFYSSNGLCFPLHIDKAHNVGDEYSVFIFCGVNFSAVSMKEILKKNLLHLYISTEI
ncbi:UNVERIFIED_CONTAM: Relaxin receptor 2 [Trichonephila clavipes]